MIPPDIAATMREALTEARHDAQRYASIYGDNAGELARIDAALAYLDTLPAAPAPDWSSAPDWAMWAILDLELGIRIVGFKYLYLEFKPELRHNVWRFDGRFESGESVQLPIGIDWRTTLVARPTE